MLAFYLKRTFHSLRRTPGLTSVMIINMALGLAIWVIAYTAVAAQRRVPVRETGTLFHVDWGTAPPSLDGLEHYQWVQALTPHLLLSSPEAERLAQHAAVRRSAKTFTSRLTVDTARGPEASAVRFSTRELFGMFQLPFAFGGPWHAQDQRAPRAEVVLDHDSNRRFFDGRNSVGRALVIGGRTFRVAGVLAATPGRLRGYDMSFSVEPAIYLPFGWANAFSVRPDYLAHRAPRGERAPLLESQNGFVQLWVELTAPGARRAYAEFLRRTARPTHGLGPPQRPMLQTPAEFIESSVPLANGFLMFRACAFIALLACSVNLSRLLIVKFQARAPELAVQRALGATRQSVFAQHMLEALLVASVAVVLGLLISALGLLGINVIVPDRPSAFSIDLPGVLMACAVGLGAGLLAGIHPAIRMCRSAPAAFLRLQ